MPPRPPSRAARSRSRAAKPSRSSKSGAYAAAPGAAPPSPVDPARWYRPDVVRELKVDEQTVARWRRAGAPFEQETTGRRRMWCEPARLRAWLAENRQKNLSQRGRPPLEKSSSDLAAAKLRKENALARRAELDVAEREGKVMERAAVEALAVGCLQELRAAFLGLAARVTPRVVGQDGATVHAIVDDEVRGILERLADGLKPLTSAPSTEGRSP